MIHDLCNRQRRSPTKMLRVGHTPHMANNVCSYSKMTDTEAKQMRWVEYSTLFYQLTELTIPPELCFQGGVIQTCIFLQALWLSKKSILFPESYQSVMHARMMNVCGKTPDLR